MEPFICKQIVCYERKFNILIKPFFYFCLLDIFESPQHTVYPSSIVTKVDFEEGESVSASDEEITGYTGDMENYTESEVDTKSLNGEGILINLHQDETNDNVDDDGGWKSSSGTQPEKIAKSVTNESISEIADKLAETEIESNQKNLTTNNPVFPGSAVKVTAESTTGGYNSSDEISKDNNDVTDVRRKKFRKHTASFNEQPEEDVTSSGEDSQSAHDEGQKRSHFPRRKTKTKEPVSEKLVEIETPSQTPHHEPVTVEEPVQPKTTKSKVATKTIAIPGFKPLEKKPQNSALPKTTPPKTINNTSSQKKRKRTRHKVYLDDPDVHQLITDHVSMLQKYIDDVAAGRTPKRELQPVGMFMLCF